MSTLEQLAQDLASGRVNVVDLSQPLDEDTPVIRLPDANFYHLGTSAQVFESLDALQQSRTRFRKCCYTSFAHESYPGVATREPMFGPTDCVSATASPFPSKPES